MSIGSFSGQTFVAFVDISGMKELVKRKKAALALGHFYETGYSILRDQAEAEIAVEGIFVSDCAVLFSAGRERHRSRDKENPQLLFERLIGLLGIVRAMNEDMVKNGWMLTTSVAYGEFVYEDRIVFKGITKNSMYGGAYVQAYLDNDHGSPKMEPGQCRIVSKGLPDEVMASLENHQCAQGDLRLIRPSYDGVRQASGHAKHFYYYWMANRPEDISGIQKFYIAANNAKYDALLSNLQDYVGSGPTPSP